MVETKISKTAHDIGNRHERNMDILFKRCHRFWNRNVAFMFLRVYLLVFFLYIALLSIYWGTYHGREKKIKRIQYLLINADDTPINGVQPYIGTAFTNIVSSPSIKAYSTWTVVNRSLFESKLHPPSDNSYFQELTRQVHQQNYWAGCMVPPNATYDYFHAIESNIATVNSSQFVYCIFESGRDFLTVQGYVKPVLVQINRALVQSASHSIINPILQALPQLRRQSYISSILSNSTTMPLITGPFTAALQDDRPVSNPATFGIIYTGLIYTVVISIQLFNFSSVVHAKLQSKLHKRSYALYRIASSQVLYIFLGLAFSLIVVAFRLPYDAAFGKSGFLVIWAATYLNLAALSGVSENILVNIFSFDRSFIGFYIVFMMCANISPIFSSVTICPRFYRYGYALPLYNYQKILIICLFDTTKRAMGRNFAVLIIWVAVTSILAPFSMKYAQRNAIRFKQLREA